MSIAYEVTRWQHTRWDEPHPLVLGAHALSAPCLTCGEALVPATFTATFVTAS
jgi:hypothetical protein